VKFSHAYTVVDGFMFNKQIKMLKSVLNQIKIADTVLINKSDIISEKEKAEVALLVSQYNPFCNILNTTFSQLPDSEFISFDDCNSIAQSIYKVDTGDYKLVSSPPNIKVDIISTPIKISEEKIDQLKIFLKSFLRAKGFVRTLTGNNIIVQAVSGVVSVSEYKLPLLRSELVFFGEGTDISEVKKLFK
jgi:G3E family GTPase